MGRKASLEDQKGRAEALFQDSCTKYACEGGARHPRDDVVAISSEAFEPSSCLGSAALGTFSQILTLEIDEPPPDAQLCLWSALGLLSNIFPIKMRNSIEFVWAMHIVDVDLWPSKANSKKGEVKYNFQSRIGKMRPVGLIPCANAARARTPKFQTNVSTIESIEYITVIGRKRAGTP